MSVAANDSQISIHYTGTLEDGTVFDSSRDRDPLAFEMGKGFIIPGLEEALVGMKVGETKKVTIAPEDAYGAEVDELVLNVERSEIPVEAELQVGAVLQSSVEGQTVYFRVEEIEGDKVTLNGNHPLAGKTLVFDVEVMTID